MPIITTLMPHRENEGERTAYALLCLRGIEGEHLGITRRLGVVGMKYFVLLHCQASLRRLVNTTP